MERMTNNIRTVALSELIVTKNKLKSKGFLPFAVKKPRKEIYLP